MAIEFDTYCGENDIGETRQHVSVQTRGPNAATGSSIYSLDSVPSPISLNDGGSHTVIIRYVPGSLAVFLDGREKPILSAAVDLQPILDPEDGRAWVGFTAAAGVGGQCHEILSWDFRPLAGPMANLRGENWPEQSQRPPEDGRASKGPAAVRPDAKLPGTESPSGSADQPAVEIAEVAADLDRYLLTRVLAFYTMFARQPHVAGPELRSKIGMAYWRIGDIQRQMGRPEQCLAAYGVACQTWRQVAAERPDVFQHQRQSAKGYTWTAVVCMQTGQYHRAVEYFTKNLQFVGSNMNLQFDVPYSHRERGRAYVVLKQYDRAIEDYTTAIQLGMNAYYERGGVRARQGDYRGAIQDWTEVLRRNPASAITWRSRAEAYERTGEWDKAIADASEAIRLSPKDTGAYNLRARAYLGKNQVDRALADYSEVIRLDPRNAGSYTNRGHVYWEEGDLDKANADFTRAVTEHEKAIEVQPTKPSAYNTLAWLLVTFPDRKVWKPARAVELAQKAVKLAPNEGAYWNTLGVAQYRAGDPKAAIGTLNKAMELRSGGDAFDCFFLAMAHWQLKNKDEARKWCDKAIAEMAKNKPEDEDLLRFRAEAAELLGIPVKPPAPKEKTEKQTMNKE